jgi:hypothetical protein
VALSQQKVLSKEAIADVQFVETSLSRVTLGKEFANCFPITAKQVVPVVQTAMRACLMTHNAKVGHLQSLCTQ